MQTALLMLALAMPGLAIMEQSIPTPQDQPICRDPQLKRAERSMPTARAETLDRQPLANQEKTVMYREDGCVKPIVVREDVGTEQR